MSGDSYFAKTMSATVEISDGVTTIEDGNITANSITTNNFTTSNFTPELSYTLVISLELQE